MSYQVIARKWRPQTFDEVTGQEVITQTLRNALEHDRLHHAYVFSGSRGVGKTTTARILAKALNCHKTDKPNLSPCSSTTVDPCPSCTEIAEGRSIDVLEIDAASHTGIGDVRETILESINFNPARDRYKVFIIDEVHQLSKPAFNALLKTLEEPPSNVVFILATTELHKVPETITSRCQEFDFRTIALPKIFDRLRLIADAESILVTDEALREIARSGEGSMRDAQSNFDQVISFSGAEIGVADVTKALGFAGVETMTTIIDAIARKDARSILNVVDDLIARGHDLRNFCRDLLGMFRDLLVYKIAGSDSDLHASAVLQAADLERLSSPFSEADLLRFFNSLALTETKLREASHARHTLEMGLVRLIEMRRVVDIENILERLSAINDGSAPPIATTQEKKTLIDAKQPVIEPEPIATPTPEVVEEAPEEPNFEQSFEPNIYDEPPEEDPFEPEELSIPEPQPEQKIASKIAASMPVRLAKLSSEELEHIADERLDAAYEEALRAIGDDLGPINSASEIVNVLFGETETLAPRVAYSNGNGAAATAPKRDMSHLIPDLKPSTDNIELPVLGDDPTQDELIAYANAHPTVRIAKHIFKAEVVEASRT